MKEKKNTIIIIILLILIFSVVAFIGFNMIKNKNNKTMNHEDSNIVSNSDYDLSYNIDNQFINLTLTNKTNSDISFNQIVVKFAGNIVAAYQSSLTLLANSTLPIAFENNYEIESNSKIDVVLYHSITEDLKNIGSYVCVKDKKSTSDYDSSFKYTFTYTGKTIHSRKVYDEYQFKNEDVYKNFKYKVEVDSAYVGETENDEKNLIRRFIWPITYDIPNTINNTESNYVKYLEESYGFSCEKEN